MTVALQRAGTQSSPPLDGVLQGEMAAVRGTVVDAVSPHGLPALSAALRCQLAAGRSITAVVQAHLDRTAVVAIAIESTRRLRRKSRVECDRRPLSVALGDALLGRVIDLPGRPPDGGPDALGTIIKPVQRAPRGAAIGLVVVFAQIPSAGLAQTVEEKGLTIAVEAERRDSGFGDSTAVLQMILRSRAGDERTRALRSRVLERTGEGDRSLVVFDSPPDVRGTALLTFANKVGDDDQWLYLPALKRVRRIASSNRSGPFMGSEFAYEDLASQAVEKFTYRWQRDETCPGEDYNSLVCFVVERRPAGATSGYTRQLGWFDQREYRTVRIDYYDRKNVLLKTLLLARYQRYLGRFWRAGEMLMTNHQTDKSTRLVWSRYEFRVGLRESDFDPQNLTRVR